MSGLDASTHRPKVSSIAQIFDGQLDDRIWGAGADKLIRILGYACTGAGKLRHQGYLDSSKTL